MKTLAAILSFAVLPAAFGATELVMYEGVTIKAQRDGSSISVRSGKGIDRTYEWNDCTLKSHMGERRQRWFGSMGIYDPAPSFGFSFSPRGCSGISRTVVEEGQIHFDDLRFASEWIRRRPSSYKTVWTNDGLLVSWTTVPGRTQLNVDVWLMCINGRRPAQLDGATDSAITVTANPKGQSIYDCAVVGKDVIDQTRTQLEAEWKNVDEWIARSREYEKRKQQR